jgi:succinate dehydrogenase / fumarate reductase membrane anchor subunit
MGVNNKKSKGQKSIIAWFFQRLSGAALIFLVAIHVWNLHYAHPEVPPTYADLVDRLHTIGYIALDISLLVLALFHGLNGVRNIVLDYSRKEAVIKRWNITLGLIGIVFSLFGAAAIVKIVTMG